MNGGAARGIIAGMVLAAAGAAGCDLFYSGSPPPGAKEQAGYADYRTYCARCHGLDGRSDRPEKVSGNRVDLVDARWRAGVSRDSLEQVVRLGKGKMKGLEVDMSPEQIRRVVDYVLWMPVDSSAAPEGAREGAR